MIHLITLKNSALDKTNQHHDKAASEKLDKNVAKESGATRCEFNQLFSSLKFFSSTGNNKNTKTVSEN